MLYNVYNICDIINVIILLAITIHITQQLLCNKICNNYIILHKNIIILYNKIYIHNKYGLLYYRCNSLSSVALLSL